MTTSTPPQIDDRRFSADSIEIVANQIHQTYCLLLAEPTALAPGHDDVITLHALRNAILATPRELLDAALRHLDESLTAEITSADDPTPEDHAAAVWITPPEPDDDLAEWAHHLGWITE